MKPKYIFGAVFAICVLMFLVLPQIANTPRTANAAPVGSAGIGAANVAGAVPRALTPESAETLPTPLPTLAPIAQAEPQPAPEQVVEQPQPAPAEVNLPSPVDANAAPGQGLASNPATTSQPDLEGFVRTVSNGQESQLVGVYVQGQFALPVIQQPAGQVNYVSTDDQIVTEYSRSAGYGVIGLLAHNTLSSGQSFFKLKPGQEVVLVYGNGRQARYRVERIENYQALGPTDPFSDFIDLNGPGQQLIRNQELFQRIYEVSGQLVFQTCFEANGDPSWGRMFVIANPI